MAVHIYRSAYWMIVDVVSSLSFVVSKIAGSLRRRSYVPILVMCGRSVDARQLLAMFLFPTLWRKRV